MQALEKILEEIAEKIKVAINMEEAFIAAYEEAREQQSRILEEGVASIYDYPFSVVENMMKDIENTRNNSPSVAAMKELQHYQELQKQGRLLELPCKPGDIVHIIDPVEKVYERAAAVASIEIDEDAIYIMIYDDASLNFSSSAYIPEDFGKTVFRTKEDAMKVLEEMRSGHKNNKSD